MCVYLFHAASPYVRVLGVVWCVVGDAVRRGSQQDPAKYAFVSSVHPYPGLLSPDPSKVRPAPRLYEDTTLKDVYGKSRPHF